jgi:hypothetical protein
MTNEQDPTAVRADLIDRVQRSWEELRAAVDRLDGRQLDVAGPDAWSVKDHLVHLERWEAYLLAELEGRDGRRELGIAEGEEPGTDAINDAIQRRHAATPSGEARRRLEETHARVVAVLQTVGAAELQRRLRRIAGNTHEHFDEHRGLISSPGAASTG